MVPVKLCYTDDNHYISEGPTRVTLRGASSGYKASIAKTPCNSSDDLLNKNEDCEGVKLSVATRSGNKTTLPSRMQFGQGKRASSSYKKGQSCNNRKTSRSAESSNLKRNNPVLRKIIETLTDKINDVNAEQKIYSYLDFIDQNGTSSPFFVTKSSREHSKLRKSKRQKVALDHFKSHEEALKPASRKGLIEQKMATFKKQFSSFTAAFKLQRDENAKLKVFIAQMMKDQNESITMSPHE